MPKTDHLNKFKQLARKPDSLSELHPSFTNRFAKKTLVLQKNTHIKNKGNTISLYNHCIPHSASISRNLSDPKNNARSFM